MIVLRDYQQDLIDKIYQSTSKRNCIQAATGFGKTAVFSYIAQNYKGNVLILVNRQELVEQTAEHLDVKEVGYITAKIKTIPTNRITIAMIETFYNRLKKGLINTNDYDIIIADEVHNLQFTKCFEGYRNRLLGFTATPVTDKREFFFKCKYCHSKHNEKVRCCKHETHEYSKSVSLKRWYGDLIQGSSIEYLIDEGYLVDVENYICNTPNLDKLKTDKSGQFTAESEKEVFDNLTSIKNLVANYKEHSLGLKTMVFNSNINSNKKAFETFTDLGYNVRSYDSKSNDDRKEIVNWFRNTPDAILMSVGVFTTGFDVKEVQSIILNRATKSLSLYHQMVGRGGRTTNKIFKPSFKMIDLGGNVERFKSWSDYTDWEEIYNNEKEKKKSVKVLEDYKNCHSCGAMIKDYDCDYCGAEEKKSKKSSVKGVIEIAEKQDVLKPPRAKHILNYAISNDLDVNKAKTLTANYLTDIVIAKKTPLEYYLRNKYPIRKRVKEIITPIYFELHNSDLEGNRVKTIDSFVNKVVKKIEKYYGI